MTDKKERILFAALGLFAEEGYTATSTSKVAKHAEVSEGLIFRHFKNKEGLLVAVLQLGEAAAQKMFAEIVFENDAKAAIRQSILLPFNAYDDLESRKFWRLMYKLKWEVEYNMSNKMELMIDALKRKFTELDYESPDLEAEFLVQTIDGIGAALLKDNLSDPNAMKAFLLNRYKV